MSQPKNSMSDQVQAIKHVSFERKIYFETLLILATVSYLCIEFFLLTEKNCCNLFHKIPYFMSIKANPEQQLR